MKTQKPFQTESTFSTNKHVDVTAAKTNIKRDGKIKDISVAIYDVDYAIKFYIETVIKPTIVEDNAVITVPVQFAAGEKWASIQKHGYLRDNQGKILTPLLMIKRNSISKREDIQDLKVSEAPEARMLIQKQYTAENRYDRFSISNKTPEKEYYSVDVPKFVDIEYELLAWTNNTSQLNEIIEQMMYFDGKAFGDTWKFTTYIDAPMMDNMNMTGEDRISRCTFNLRTKAHILSSHSLNHVPMYKLNPANTVIIMTEVEA